MQSFKYLIDPAGAPRWLRATFRRLPLRMITIAALLGGCMNPLARTATPAVDAGWETLAPGLERRFYRPGGEYTLTQLLALRIDPALYSFRAHYRPGAALPLAGWRDLLPGAVAFINANFFDPQGNALGLVVADGIAYGQAYQGMGGMLQVQNGGVRVRSTILEPYAGEALEQAVQAFPMLMTNGQASFANTQGDRISRRTVAAQDVQGRIVLIATSSLIGMRLVDLSRYLASTDLQLVNAVNLDGGGSTLLALNVPGQPPYEVPSLDAVPTVLAVYPR
ncbi:MAG: phosphodiester glycosidase family protein [Chloroflexota bacterium]